MVVEVFPGHDLEVTTSLGFILELMVYVKMYITVTDVMRKKKIDLAYPIWGMEVAIISLFSDNIQYQIRESLNVLLIMNKEKLLPKGKFTGKELSTFVEKKVITTPLDTSENVIKMDKLVRVTEVVFSLEELDNTDNLEERNLSNVLLRHHVTANGEFTSFEQVTPQYKRLKNWELNSLTLRIMDQNDNSITDGPGMTIFLHIR